MRFNFFRDRLFIEPTFTGMFNPSSGFTAFKSTETKPNNTPVADSPSTESHKFNATQLKEKLGITEEAAKLLTDGGKVSLTEKEVLEKLQSPEKITDKITGKITDRSTYNISRIADSRADGFEAFNNAALIKRVDGLDNQLGNISIKDGNLAWGVAGAVEQPQTASTTERKKAGFADHKFNDPKNVELLENDTKTIQSALEKTGGDKNQKIEYQGILLTDSSDGSDRSYGSDNVRLYKLGEGENATYVPILQSTGEVLSKEALLAHLTKLKANKPELDIGKFGEIKPDQYLKTEA